MLIFLYSILVIITLFFIGFGPTNILIPNKLKQFGLWLMPWFGLICLIIFLVVFSFAGLSIRYASIFLLIISFIFNVFIIFTKKSKLEFNLLEDTISLGLILLGLIFLIDPLFRIHNFPTTISLGNNDIIAYVEGADFLINNSITKVIYSPVRYGAYDIILGSFRFGPTVIYSFFAFLLNLKVYQITYIIQSAIFPLVAPLVYILIKLLYKKKSTVALILSFVMIIFNVNILYMHYHNFFPHTIFRGISVFILIFLIPYLFDEKNNELNNKYILIISSSLSALYFSYHEPTIFFIAPIGLFFLISLIFKNSHKYFHKLTRIIFVSSIISLPSVIYNLRFIIYQFKAAIGDQYIGWQIFRRQIPYANPFEIFGFYSIHSFKPLINPLAIILSILVLTIIFYGLSKIKYKLFISCFIFIYIILLIRTSLINPNFFDYARILSYILFFFVALFVIGIINLFHKNKIILIVLVFILAGLCLFSARKLDQRFVTERLSVDKGYISLSHIQNGTTIINQPIYIDNNFNSNIPYWNKIWSSYFLSLNNPPIDISVSKNKVPEGSLVLVSKVIRNFPSIKSFVNEIVWENEFYKIGKLCISDNCLISQKEDLSHITFGDSAFEDNLMLTGWDVNEGESRWANEKESTLRLITKGSYPTNLVIEALSLGKQQEMTIYIDNKLIDSVSIGTEWKTYNMPINYPLSFGVHKIKFIYTKGYRPMDIIPGNLDSRTLYVNFKEIRIK